MSTVAVILTEAEGEPIIVGVYSSRDSAEAALDDIAVDHDEDLRDLIRSEYVITEHPLRP